MKPPTQIDLKKDDTAAEKRQPEQSVARAAARLGAALAAPVLPKSPQKIVYHTKTGTSVQNFVRTESKLDFLDFFNFDKNPIRESELLDNHVGTPVNISNPIAQRMDMLIKFKRWKVNLRKNPNPDFPLDMTYFDWLELKLMPNNISISSRWALSEPTYMNKGIVNEEYFDTFKEEISNIDRDTLEYAHIRHRKTETRPDPHNEGYDIVESESPFFPTRQVYRSPPELPSREELESDPIPRVPPRDRAMTLPNLSEMRSAERPAAPVNIPRRRARYKVAPQPTNQSHEYEKLSKSLEDLDPKME